MVTLELLCFSVMGMRAWAILVKLDGLNSTLNPVVYGSVVNDKPVCGFSFVSGKNNEICKEYLGTGY